MPILHRFRDINTYLPNIRMSRDLNHAQLWGQFVIITRLILLCVNPCTKFGDSIFSHSREI